MTSVTDTFPENLTTLPCGLGRCVCAVYSNTGVVARLQPHEAMHYTENLPFIGPSNFGPVHGKSASQKFGAEPHNRLSFREPGLANRGRSDQRPIRVRFSVGQLPA